MYINFRIIGMDRVKNKDVGEKGGHNEFKAIHRRNDKTT